MTSEVDWPVVRLEDVADDITVGHVGPMATEYVPVGIPFLRSQNVEPFRVSLDDVKCVGEDFHARLVKSALHPGDVVIVRTGRPGSAAVIPSELPVANCADLVIVRPGPKLDARFLMYFINSAGSGHVASHLVGAVQQHFNVSSARTLRIPLPPLLEQRRIARALGALDEKIELNRRKNRTLESIARAIFKSWFVDFDPVRKKMEGKTGGELGLPPSLAALFPPAFDESELGPIPQGWRTGICSDSFAITMGQSPPGDTYNEASVGLPFYQGRRDFGERFPARRVYCVDPSRLARRGDTLVSVRAPVGDVNIATEDCCIGRGVAAVRHTSGAPLFTYEAMRALRFQFEDFEAGGTVFGSIGGKEFRNLQIVAPPLELIQGYERAMAPIGDALELAYRSSSSLTLLRDSLLPQLMAGDRRPHNSIPEAQT